MRGRSIWATEMPCWRSILPGICKARIMSVESGCQYAKRKSRSDEVFRDNGRENCNDKENQ